METDACVAACVTFIWAFLAAAITIIFTIELVSLTMERNRRRREEFEAIFRYELEEEDRAPRYREFPVDSVIKSYTFIDNDWYHNIK